jgi:DNA polymerase zeta
LIIAICEDCLDNIGNTVFTLISRQKKTQQKFQDILKTCQDCSKVNPFAIEGDQFADIPCDSLDCPVFYERLKAKKDVRTTIEYDTIIHDMTQNYY